MSTQTIANKPSLFTLILLISFGSVGATLFTPGLPSIANFFQVNITSAQLTVTLFLIGYAAGQLLYGPLSNRFGRKPALYLGISLEIISALFCALAAPLHSFTLLVVARLLMALGASVGLKMTFTLIADCYSQQEATRLIASLLFAFAITPGLGVTLGGFLVEIFNWQTCFYFLATYGVFLLVLCMHLPETHSSLDHTALHFKKIFHNYRAQLKNKQLLFCALLLGCGTAVVYAFAALAPFIAEKFLHITPAQYGLYNLIPSVGMVFGSLLATYLSHRQPAQAIIKLGILSAGFGVLIILIAFCSNYINPYTLFLPMIIIYLGFSLVFANASSLATSQASNKANASAMMNFINMATAVICVLLLGLAPSNSVLLMPLLYCGLMIASIIIFALM
jgi:MFS transporter, DHA1 family, multidrug resistance protein